MAKNKSEKVSKTKAAAESSSYTAKQITVL